MYAEGYLARKPHSRGLLVPVVAAHVALIAAISLSPWRVTVNRDGGIEVVNVPIEVPPPPPPTDTSVKPRLKPTNDPMPFDPPPQGPDASKNLTGTDTAPIFGGGGVGVEPGGGDIDITPVDPTKPPLIVGVQTDPRYARDLQPPYPPGLQRAEIEGSVTVRILVGVDGRVLRLEAVNVDNDGFLKATRDWALKKWRFKPATRDGVPYEEWITKTVRFKLDF